MFNKQILVHKTYNRYPKIVKLIANTHKGITLNTINYDSPCDLKIIDGRYVFLKLFLKKYVFLNEK